MRRLNAIIAVALFVAPGTASALQQSRLDLPSGRLGDAVLALGRQAGISIGISDPALVARRVGAVRGSMSPEQALQQLLRGTGARYVRVGGRSFRIVRGADPAPALRLASAERPFRADPPPTAVPEPDIIVTAARRPATAGNYAASMDIVDGDDPELRTGLGSTESLITRLPSISSTHLGPGRNKVFIRGIADSSFNGPTQATTGRYLGETRITYTTPDPDLRVFDLERVEVLRGPQGTLYGAGSLGGIVRLVPRAPRLDAIEGRAQAGATIISHGEVGFDAAGMINLPIVTDMLAIRISGYGAREGGYIDDPGRGLNDINRVSFGGGRAALRFAAPSGWTVDLGIAGQTIRGRDGQSADDPVLGNPPLTRTSAMAQPYSSDYVLADLVVTRDWENVRLVSSFGIVRQTSAERFDSTGSDPISGGPLAPALTNAPQAYDQETEVTMLSAETRLSGGTAGGTSWLIGTMLLSNDLEQRRTLGVVDPQNIAPLFGNVAIDLNEAVFSRVSIRRILPGVNNGTREAAVFGEVSIRPAPGLTLTAGGRFSYSRLTGGALDILVPVFSRFGAPVSGERDETAFLPSASVAFELEPDTLLFARYQEGFRPGGLSVIGDSIQEYRGDSVRTVEAGVRHARPGGPFAIQASLSYTSWTDIQADTISIAGFPITANIGDGRIYSADVSLAWRPTPMLSVELAGVFNNSEVTNPEPSIGLTSGFSLPNVADFGGRAAIDYTTFVGADMMLTVSGVARYTGASRLGAGAILGREQGEFAEISLGARLERGAHMVSLTVTNLLDQVGNRFALGSPFTIISNPQITPLRPRALRLGWELRF